MSFVPAPQQANAASAKNNAANAVTSTQAAAAATETPVSDQELLFKIRTFDVFWVDKKVCPSTVTRCTADNGVTLVLCCRVALALLSLMLAMGKDVSCFLCH
jgi:hypothetical protein